MAATRAVHLLLVLAMFTAACKTTENTGPLPRPDNPRESGYRPEVPYQPGPAERVASRTVYTTDSGRGYSVEVTDVAIGPGGAVTVPFAGPAMVEVRHGNGAGTVAGKSVEMRMGAAFTVGEGETLTVTAQEPITLRAYVYRTR